MEKLQAERSNLLIEMLGMRYQPVGFMFSDKKPKDAIGFKPSGKGCLAPLIFSAAKNKTIAFDKNSAGRPCAAFYLGYKDWIFPGIECFLSHGHIPGLECERFVGSPVHAKEYVTSLKNNELRDDAVIFKPIGKFADDEIPEAVILFANPDQMSALVYLLHYNNPLARDIITTGFASACASLFTIPMMYAKRGENKAFWGLHDISVRPFFPKDVTSLSMPFELYNEISSVVKESFLSTEKWNKLLKRIKKGLSPEEGFL